MKKKILVLTMSLVMALSFPACGNEPASGDNTTNQGNNSTQQESSDLQESSDAQESSDTQESSDDSSQASNSLQDWMESDEAKLVIDTTNKQLEGTGMSLGLSADGNIFVYEYYIADSLGLANLSEEETTAALNAQVDAQRDGINSLFSTFEESYGITLDAVRFQFFSEDGTELFSTDVTPE